MTEFDRISAHQDDTSVWWVQFYRGDIRCGVELAELLAIIQDIWKRRSTTHERGNTYTIVLTGDLIERIERALGEDVPLPEPDVDDSTPDWTDYYPTWQSYMISEYPEAFESGRWDE